MANIQHVWKEGDWSRKNGFWEKECTCVLCGMKKHLGRINKKSDPYIFFYTRSGMIFTEKYPAKCWGNKNP